MKRECNIVMRSLFDESVGKNYFSSLKLGYTKLCQQIFYLPIKCTVHNYNKIVCCINS